MTRLLCTRTNETFDYSNLACFLLDGRAGEGVSSLLRIRAKMAIIAGVGLLSDVSNLAGKFFGRSFFSADLFLGPKANVVLLKLLESVVSQSGDKLARLVVLRFELIDIIDIFQKIIQLFLRYRLVTFGEQGSRLFLILVLAFCLTFPFSVSSSVGTGSGVERFLTGELRTLLLGPLFR